MIRDYSNSEMEYRKTQVRFFPQMKEVIANTLDFHQQNVSFTSGHDVETEKKKSSLDKIV